MGLATIIGGVGAVLLLVGLVGGGFEFSGSVMPKVGRVSRVLSFATGGLLLLTALGLAIGEPTPSSSDAAYSPRAAQSADGDNPPPAVPAPAIGYVLAGTDSTAYVFELPDSSSTVLTKIHDGSQVAILCTAQGESITSPITGLTSSLWNYTSDGGFVPDVMIDTGTAQATMPNC